MNFVAFFYLISPQNLPYYTIVRKKGSVHTVTVLDNISIVM